ncbi:DgyrCDS7278 [Dimorphilus gyrociliatus]|nr:DgyrCDS7278 [Dimorphilus gyrociliatus]
MHLIVETLFTVILVLYYLIESIVWTFLPNSWRYKDVQNQTVLITGAGSGLGRLLAFRFAKLGCATVLWDIDSKGNAKTAAEIKQRYNSECLTYTVDLSSKESIYETANKVKEDIGEINILINNAGIVTGKKFMECQDALIEKTFQVNTSAHFWTTKAFLPRMLKLNHGHIVNIASAAGLTGVTGLADYCASKFAVVGFTESLSMELTSLEKTGVKTTVVCPYYIDTGMFKGVKTKFPEILPIVTPEHAVDRMMDGILSNKSEVWIPRSLYVLLSVKG